MYLSFGTFAEDLRIYSEVSDKGLRNAAPANLSCSGFHRISAAVSFSRLLPNIVGCIRRLSEESRDFQYYSLL